MVDVNKQPCQLCGRLLGDQLIEQHHLIPKSRKGKQTEPIHKICHRKIHSLFTDKELEDYYHTFDRLKQHSDIEKFIKWVVKKPPDYHDTSREAKRRKR